MSANRRVLSSPARFAWAAAQHLAALVRRTVAARGRCALALAGGRTPQPVYRRLAEPPLVTRIPWHLLDVYFGDERAVAPDDPQSNYRMAADALLTRVPLDPERVHRIEADRSDRDQAARDYEGVLPERLDVLLLGMGADGHTASLFPGSATLSERRRRVVPVIGAGPVPERLTITPPVIAAARKIVVLVAGAEKADAVRAALGRRGEPTEIPARLALGGTWFLTADAAARWREEQA